MIAILPLPLVCGRKL